MRVQLPITVIAFETDYGGVVSNTRYVEYIERGRYALLHAAGLKVSEILAAHGVQPVVRRVDVEYLGFALHEDELQLSIWVAEHSGARTILQYELVRCMNNSVLMRATQTLAYLGAGARPVRVPQLFREALLPEERPAEIR